MSISGTSLYRKNSIPVPTRKLSPIPILELEPITILSLILISDSIHVSFYMHFHNLGLIFKRMNIAISSVPSDPIINLNQWIALYISASLCPSSKEWSNIFPFRIGDTKAIHCSVPNFIDMAICLAMLTDRTVVCGENNTKIGKLAIFFTLHTNEGRRKYEI